MKLIDNNQSATAMYSVFNPISDTDQMVLTTTETPDQNAYSSVVQDGLRQLSALRRTVFKMRSEQGLSNEEVAAQLQISVDTVKHQYYHACRFLRDYSRQHHGFKAMRIVMTTFCN